MTYAYDKNGNMVKNLDKNISEIKYNVLNLPSQITTGADKEYKITYTYDALGRKLQAYYRRKTMDVIIPKRQQAKSITLSSRFDGIIGKPVLPDTLVFSPISYTPDEERFSSVLKYLNNIRRTVYYGDGYEEVSDDSLGNYSITYLGEDIIGVKRNNAVTYYYLLTDHQGSVLGIYDASGTEKYSATYDAWGQQTVTRNDIGFLRGYTGHEMMPEFKLINMNGRLYDPLLARFLSPDNYVQLPDFSQSLNRYTYCLNNPLKYTDPSGEMAFIAGVAGFLKGAHRVIFHKGKLSSLFKYPLKFIKNDFKITWGLTKGSATQLLSRFTWELPQTAIGYLYSDARNTLGHVDHVRYFDGATYVIRDSHKTEEGVTIGNYINISSPDGVPLDKNGHFSPMENPLYMHEYGHYIQSQEYGWGYLFSVGIPSLVSAGITNKGKRVTITELNINKPITISKHRTRWYERKANKKARDYFVNKYGVEWPYEEFPVDF